MHCGTRVSRHHKIVLRFSVTCLVQHLILRYLKVKQVPWGVDSYKRTGPMECLKKVTAPSFLPEKNTACIRGCFSTRKDCQHMKQKTSVIFLSSKNTTRSGATRLL